MKQRCLEGICCRDSVPRSEAERFGLDFDHPCNPDSPLCGCPNKNALALEQWRECGNDADLDFVCPQGIPKLPSCVPNLQPRENARKYSHPALAVKATDVGGVLSHDRRRLIRWRQRYGVPERTSLLVHQESRDIAQERLWKAMRSGASFEEMRMLRNLIFIAEGFSVYDDGSLCSLRQVLHMRLSLREAARANSAGLCTVPTFGWNHHRASDLEFLSRWCIRQGEKLTTIAVNAQTGSIACELRNLAMGMMRIEEFVGRNYQWIVFGGRRRIEALTEFIPRSRVVQVAREVDFQTPVEYRADGMSLR